MLPALDRLSLSRTGEFYPLSQAEVDALNKDGAQEPFSTEPYQKDVDAYGFGNWRRFVPGVQPNDEDAQWHTFRVRSTEPSADGTYKYRYYRAESLWRWHKDNRNDPITREPIWYEDWWELHDAYDKEGLVPSWVYTLPTRDPGTIVVRPAQPGLLPSMTRTVDNRGNGREWAFAEESEDEDDASGMPPGTPTPLPVRRQPNIPNLTPERVAARDAAFDAYRRADEAFEREFQAWQTIERADMFYLLLDAQVDADVAQLRVVEVLQSLPGRYDESWQWDRAPDGRHQGRDRRDTQVAAVRERLDAHLRLIVADRDLIDELRAKQLAWDRMNGPFTRRPTVYELEDQDMELRIVEDLVLEALRRNMRAASMEDSVRARAQFDFLQQQRTRRGNAIYRWRQLQEEGIPYVLASAALRNSWSGWFAERELIPPPLDPTTGEGWDD